MSWTHLALGYTGFLSVMSVVTFIMFAWDKYRAKKGRWRIREQTLHTMELLGGWPGAFLGMYGLRHKSAKKSYRLVLGAMMLLHIAVISAAVVIVLRWNRGPVP